MQQIILVSGLSGSGKSVALKALEDVGYFAVDNLPATMILPLLAEQAEVDKMAVAIDVRGGAGIDTVPATLHSLRERNLDCRVIFLEATDDALCRRFAETRRPHPLAKVITGGVIACIDEERRRLTNIAELGHRLDTSVATASQLRGWIADWLQQDQSLLALTFESFGFKHGIPLDADFVFDARFLPNPYYDPALRALNGRDPPVRAFLEADLNAAHFIDDIASFLLRWLPSFARDHRAALTIAIGCTGGQHRSVYIIEELATRFGTSQQVLTRHRDLA